MVPIICVNHQLIVIRWLSSLPPTEIYIVRNGRIQKEKISPDQRQWSSKKAGTCAITQLYTHNRSTGERNIQKQSISLIIFTMNIRFPKYISHKIYISKATETWEENKYNMHSLSLTPTNRRPKRPNHRAIGECLLLVSAGNPQAGTPRAESASR